MPRTVWYPGHMAKGRRQLETLAANIDLMIEVRDARAPRLTSSPLLSLFSGRIETLVALSKADLADEKMTKRWKAELKKSGFASFALDLRKGGVGDLSKMMTARKPSFRDLRVAVVGIPNVGKSMLINQLVGRKAARVGGIPGITRGVSWFSGRGFLLADSPGILDPHSGAKAHKLISWIGSSRGQVIGDTEEHAKECIAFLIAKGLWQGVEKAWNVKAEGTPAEILENIGVRLGRLKSGGAVDTASTGSIFLESFASGRFGRMSLEAPEDPPLWETI